MSVCRYAEASNLSLSCWSDIGFPDDDDGFSKEVVAAKLAFEVSWDDGFARLESDTARHPGNGEIRWDEVRGPSPTVEGVADHEDRVPAFAKAPVTFPQCFPHIGEVALEESVPPRLCL